MQVTGYMIREALKRQELRRTTLATQAKSALWAFEGEDKMTADQSLSGLKQVEEAIADLQVLQDRYNLAVIVNVQGTPMALARAVKILGGAGRIEKQWRDFAIDTGRRGYNDESLSRSKDEVRATRTLSAKECLDRASKAAGYAGSLRAAIAEANANKLQVEGLDTSLFE